MGLLTRGPYAFQAEVVEAFIAILLHHLLLMLLLILQQALHNPILLFPPDAIIGVIEQAALSRIDHSLILLQLRLDHWHWRPLLEVKVEESLLLPGVPDVAGNVGVDVADVAEVA